jgi:hypothetical protein
MPSSNDQSTYKNSNYIQSKGNNGLAIASLVLGVTSVFGMGPLTGIPAIIIGYKSLKNPVYKELGIAGIVMGGISTGLALMAMLLFILFFLIIAFSVGSAPIEGGIHEEPQPQSSQTRTQQI